MLARRGLELGTPRFPIEVSGGVWGRGAPLRPQIRTELRVSPGIRSRHGTRTSLQIATILRSFPRRRAIVCSCNRAAAEESLQIATLASQHLVLGGPHLGLARALGRL